MRDTKLRVYCWDELAGRLEWSGNRKAFLFFYDRDFLKKGHDLFPLLHPIAQGNENIAFVGERAPGSKADGLPPFIADSLPDDWGSLLFADWAKENHLNVDKISKLEKLSYIGTRGVGALEFIPEVRFPKDKEELRLGEIVSLARKITRQRGNLSILPGESKTLQRLFELGSSAGGRRPKAFIAIDRETGEIRSGQVKQKDSYDYFILKVNDNPKIPFNRIEMTYYEMAVEAGLPMSPSRLMDIDGAKCFLTQRFDRVQGEKVHTQTLAAMRPTADSYGKLLETCRMLGLPAEDIETVFRQAAFNAFSGNTDDHARNFSFMLRKGGRWRLSPPYDINYIVHGLNEDARGEHCLPLAGKIDGITEDDLTRLALDNSIPFSGKIVERVCAAITTFRDKARKNGMPAYWIDRIEKDLHGLLPDRFKEKVNAWSVETGPEEIDGVKIENVSFEMTEGGDFKFSAVIDGHETRKVFSKNKPECLDIIRKGGNGMTPEHKAEYIKTHLFPIALKASGGLDYGLSRQFGDLMRFGFPFRDLLELAKTGRCWVQNEIFHTPTLGIPEEGDKDKPKKKVDIVLTLSQGNILVSDPYSNRMIGEAMQVLESQRNLDFGKSEGTVKTDSGLAEQNNPHV